MTACITSRLAVDQFPNPGNARLAGGILQFCQDSSGLGKEKMVLGGGCGRAGPTFFAKSK